jgi:hypothetical protein
VTVTRAARTAPVTVTRAARALQAVRAGYGIVLVLTPGLALRLANGRLAPGQRPGRRARRVVRVLGIRHLVQAALTAAAPTPAVFAVGRQVDAVHAASMLVAGLWPAERRAALADALVEAALAAGGAAAGRQARR